MAQKIRLTVEPTDGAQKEVDLPEDWEDLDGNEREDYLLEEARSLMEDTVTFYGEVVD